MKSFLYFLVLLFISADARSQNLVINYFTADVYPESIVYYPARKQFIVGSMKKGQIGSVNDKGEYSVLLNDTSLVATSGLKIKGDDLYALSGDLGYSSNSSEKSKYNVARLVKIDLRSNKITSVINLDTLFKGRHFVNDLAIDDTGNIYITDSFSPVIYKVRPDGRASVWVNRDEFKSDERNLNGIVFHKNGYLLVALSQSGRLFKIDVADSSKITEVEIPGDFKGINGLRFTENHLLVMSQTQGYNQVHILNSNNSWKTAKVLRTDNYKYIHPNKSEIVGTKIYVVDSNVEELNKSAGPSSSFSVRVIDLQKRLSRKNRREGKVSVGPLQRKKKQN
jgi:sugar lactone lactonase YvrE